MFTWVSSTFATSVTVSIVSPIRCSSAQKGITGITAASRSLRLRNILASCHHDVHVDTDALLWGSDGVFRPMPGMSIGHNTPLNISTVLRSSSISACEGQASENAWESYCNGTDSSVSLRLSARQVARREPYGMTEPERPNGRRVRNQGHATAYGNLNLSLPQTVGRS